jgi:hypothetical protein
MIEENLIVMCVGCGKDFETPFHLDEGEEHPDRCQDCPPSFEL